AKRAAAHEATADGCSQLADKGWGIVVRFYAALHWVDAYLTTKETVLAKPESHGERDAAIQRNTELSSGRGTQFRAAYKRLKSMSVQVRYYPSYVARDQE